MFETVFDAVTRENLNRMRERAETAWQDYQKASTNLMLAPDENK